MSEVLIYYRQVNPTTWAYLSSLLIIALYFKFNRFWSVRNLDLVLLILLAPGLLLIHFGENLRTTAREWRPAPAPELNAVPDEPPPATDGIEKESNPQQDSALATGLLKAADSPLIDQSSADPKMGADDPSVKQENAELPKTDQQSQPPSKDTTRNEQDEPQEAVKIPEAPSSKPETVVLADYGVLPVIRNAADRDAVAKLGIERMRYGFLWLHGVGALLLVRLLLDSTMSRRPLLEPNLTQGGLTFVACALFLFLMANVIKNSPSKEDMAGPIAAAEIVKGQALTDPGQTARRQGPGSALIALLPSIPTIPILGEQAREPSVQERAYANVARGMAIGSHLAIALGMVLIGYRHFDNLKMGVGAAALFLMLPYTSQMTGRVEHALPAALLIWAVACYRQPTIAGILLGLAAGVVYYPLFLLPLWLSFYWPRGLMRFVSGLSYSLVTCVLALFFFSRNMSEFWNYIVAMFGVWIPRTSGLEGIWSEGWGWDEMYRLPVITAFLVLSISMALWPAQKNLGTLLSCTGAVMVGTQFWHGYGGGLFMAWYLPLLLLTVFRPNLEDRVALSVLGEGWFPRRRRREIRAFDRAAFGIVSSGK